MKLEVVKMGCDFDYLHNKRQMDFSDLENHRLRMRFTDKKGRRIYGDVTCWDVEYWQKTTKDKRRLPPFAVGVDLSVYGTYKFGNSPRHVGCFRYTINEHSETYPYTKKGLLDLINSASRDVYDDIEFVSHDRLYEWAAWQDKDRMKIEEKLKEEEINA